MTTRTTVTSTTPITRGMSPWTVARTVSLAEPGNREDHLDDHRAAEQADELEAEHRQARTRGVAEHVLVDDPTFREATAAQGAHVVEPERVDHRAADLGGDPRDAAQRQRDDRQGDRRQPTRRRLGELGVAGGFEPAQVDREHQHQTERDQEARDREAEHGHDLRQPVGPAPALGGQHPECHGDDRGHQRRADDQGERDGDPAGQCLGHRLARDPGDPQVTLEGVGHPVAEAGEQRLVETELLLLQRDRLLGRRLAQDVAGDVARGDVEQEVGKGRQDHDQDEACGKPSHHEPKHGELLDE